MNVESISFYINAAALVIVMVLWFIFLGSILLSKKPQSPPDAKREPWSWIGLGLQGAGYLVVWIMPRRPFFSPMIEGQFVLSTALSIIAVLIAAVSVWLAIAAIKELGRQWSLTARLTEGHKLVTTGVYGLVRHPIYTAMLGMLVATGVVLSDWPGRVIGFAFFLIGTFIRIRFEEKLLTHAFGKEFAEWKSCVPALIPDLKKPFRKN